MTATTYHLGLVLTVFILLLQADALRGGFKATQRWLSVIERISRDDMITPQESRAF